MDEPKKKNWFARHKVLSVILGLIVLGVVASAAGGGKTEQTSKPGPVKATTTEQKQPEKAKLDIATFYSKVESGMTKEQVVELASKDPGNCSESETQGVGKIEVCFWYGSLGDKAVATVTFQDGKVMSKTKTGF